MIRELKLAAILFVLATPASSQSDPIKIGEYQSPTTGRLQVGKEVERFIKRLEMEPKSTRGAIALINGFKFVGPCVGNRPVEDRSFERAVRKSIPKKYRNRVLIVRADYWSLFGEAEFYLLPLGAEPPRKIERFVNPPCCCPTSRIRGPSEARSDSRSIKYELVLPDGGHKNLPPVEWKVVGGTIISGQGTLKIRVRAHRESEEVRLNAEMSAACGCLTEASFSTSIIKR